MRRCVLLVFFALGCGSGDRGSVPSPPPEPFAANPLAAGVAMFKPLPGRLTSHVFDNEFLNIPPMLVYDIELPLEPFDYKGQATRTEVRLDRIRFGVTAWRELAGREFRFAVNPTPGYIDGSVYVGGAHNPADVTRIKFGPLLGNKLTAEIDIRFDFEYEGVDGLGTPSATWQVVLELDTEALDKVAAGFEK